MCDDGWLPQPLGTGHMILAERDLGRNRPPRKRQFPFGFGLPKVVNRAARNAPVRNRHRGSVARRQP